MELIEYNSELWEQFRGAYGCVLEDIQDLMKETATEEEQRDAFENLCENLWHQLSFYDATYIALPYLVTVLEKKQDFQWQLDLISEMGICIMTDIPRNHYHQVDNQMVLTSYNQAIERLREKTKLFLLENMDAIKKLDESNLSYFCTAVLAILGDREAAFVMNSLYFNECYVFCDKCEFYNETMNPFSEGVSECIVPAENVIGKWDGEDYQDTYVWFTNWLNQLNAEYLVRNLTYYYGTYTCPKCGRKHLVMDAAKKYFDI